MMDGLEVPLHLTGVNIKSYNGVAEQVIALAIESIEVARGAAVGRVKRIARLIHGHVEAPIVDSSAILPLVAGPAFVPKFARMRNRVELPFLHTGASIVGAGVPRSARSRLLADIRAE